MNNCHRKGTKTAEYYYHLCLLQFYSGALLFPLFLLSFLWFLLYVKNSNRTLKRTHFNFSTFLCWSISFSTFLQIFIVLKLGHWNLRKTGCITFHFTRGHYSSNMMLSRVILDFRDWAHVKSEDPSKQILSRSEKWCFFAIEDPMMSVLCFRRNASGRIVPAAATVRRFHWRFGDVRRSYVSMPASSVHEWRCMRSSKDAQ